jgi:hypothetical protein
MGDATQILQAIEQGDPSAAEWLLPLVYEGLRRLAAAKLANKRPGPSPLRHPSIWSNAATP